MSQSMVTQFIRNDRLGQIQRLYREQRAATRLIFEPKISAVLSSEARMAA